MSVGVVTRGGTAEPSCRDQREQELGLTADPRRVLENIIRYGARRIAAELDDLGRCVVHDSCKNAGEIKACGAILPKSFVPKTTDSQHRLGYSPNLILDTPDPCGVNQLWVGDITYVPLCGGAFSYLAVLMDRYSRNIVGWELAETMTDELTLAALRMAIRERQPSAMLVHHTDRGGQYASNRYRAVLRRADIVQSMSRADNVYDNAFMESCFGTFKTELEMTEYENHRSARGQLSEYIDYYRKDRKHSALSYLTPNQFERLGTSGS